jgi:hypothetical protein
MPSSDDVSVPAVDSDTPDDTPVPESTDTPVAAPPAELLTDDSSDPVSTDDNIDSSAPVSDDDTTTPSDDATASAFDTPVTPANADTDDLVAIKQQALQDLTPLVDKLDQPAEEQFRTLMRMIQASDNPSLIKQAFETAQKITDDKERAQALLDVINEINYFTVQNKSV